MTRVDSCCLLYVVSAPPLYGAVAQWYSQRTTVLEVAGSIPAPVIVELL